MTLGACVGLLGAADFERGDLSVNRRADTGFPTSMDAASRTARLTVALEIGGITHVGVREEISSPPD